MDFIDKNKGKGFVPRGLGKPHQAARMNRFAKSKGTKNIRRNSM